MRLKDYDERDGKRVWLSESELSLLLDNTTPNHREQEAAFLLAGRERCYAETGEDGWEYVGPHDLRRSWGVRLLEAGVLPSVVMEWGGWEDWQTFRNHYLAEFSPEALRRERGKVGWLAEGRGEGHVGGSNPGYAAVDPGRGGRY